MRIKLKTPEQINRFVNICSTYNCDVNVQYGSNTFDGKSIVAMCYIGTGNEISVNIISDGPQLIEKFANEMKEFEGEEVNS